MKNKKNTGFSLLELLACISIISVISSLLFSALQSSREKGYQAKCINNQHNLIQAVILFALDEEHLPTSIACLANDGYLDGRSTRSQQGYAYADSTVLSPYYNSVFELTKCPKVHGTIMDDPPVYSYGMSEQLTGISYHLIKNPSKLVVIADSDTPFISSIDQVAPRHKLGAIGAYADGHVEWVKDGEFTIPENEPNAVTEIFEIIEGSVIVSTASSTTVIPLAAQYAQSSSSWYDVYITMEVTTPDGETTSSYEVMSSETDGLNGGMTQEELMEFMWESPEFESESSINIISTAKYWTKKWKKVNGRWRKVWVQKTKRSWNTNDDVDSQVWVLKDGDPVPEVPGLNGQISVAEAVSGYVERAEDGNDYVSLAENEVIYFFEIGQTNPYYSNGAPNPGYDCNDLVVLMTIDTYENVE
ncbi:MAG: prepilin-type N-terminal cleavage/methylation domain-containing protein [Candidatus Theseobacter exili]|nr:prepilin-type N-terminal cleavage/methylation domain-containing protein [Candidatus Theseobacter exili]